MEIVEQGIKGLQLPIDVGDSPTRLLSNTVKPQRRCWVCKSLCRCSLVWQQHSHSTSCTKICLWQITSLQSKFVVNSSALQATFFLKSFQIPQASSVSRCPVINITHQGMDSLSLRLLVD